MTDKDGFIWVATEGGLNRWDGFRFITIDGPDNAFVNGSIINIFADSHNNLWISTYNSGVYRYDLHENKVYSLPPHNFPDSPDWIQAGYSFDELEDGSILIGLDQQVLLYDVNTQQENVVFELTTSQKKNDFEIRDILHSNNELFIATNNGLFIKELGSNLPAKEFNYLGSEAPNKQNTNVKMLVITGNNQLMVGTVGGLFVGSFVRRIDGTPASAFDVAVPLRNIWDISQIDSEHFWLGTDIGLLKLKKTDKKERGRALRTANA